MILGLELLQEERQLNGMTPIGVDNIAAIIATQSIKPKPGHHLWDLFHRRLQIVTNKHKDMDLLVKWTPGHIDIKGNEEADREAKDAVRYGSSTIQKLPAPLRKALPCSKSAAQQMFHQKIKKAAGKIWNKSPCYN